MWECAFDLVNCLSEMSVNFAGKTVLELGCGAGLPGIFHSFLGLNVFISRISTLKCWITSLFPV